MMQKRKLGNSGLEVSALGFGLKENVGASAVELTPSDLRQIEEALAQIKVQGDRYPAHLAARVGR